MKFLGTYSKNQDLRENPQISRRGLMLSNLFAQRTCLWDRKKGCLYRIWRKSIQYCRSTYILCGLQQKSNFTCFCLHFRSQNCKIASPQMKAQKKHRRQDINIYDISLSHTMFSLIHNESTELELHSMSLLWIMKLRYPKFDNEIERSFLHIWKDFFIAKVWWWRFAENYSFSFITYQTVGRE